MSISLKNIFDIPRAIDTIICNSYSHFHKEVFHSYG